MAGADKGRSTCGQSRNRRTCPCGGCERHDFPGGHGGRCWRTMGRAWRIKHAVWLGGRATLSTTRRASIYTGSAAAGGRKGVRGKSLPATVGRRVFARSADAALRLFPKSLCCLFCWGAFWVFLALFSISSEECPMYHSRVKRTKKGRFPSTEGIRECRGRFGTRFLHCCDGRSCVRQSSQRLLGSLSTYP